MKPLRINWGLPLFAKELTEQAARTRTYVVRVAYACSFFLAAFVMFRTTFAQAQDAYALLGQGGKMFDTLVMIQFGGIFLFMPAITSGAITHEKERNCLGLLLLTRLSPLTILIEKLLSRLIPMYTFLLLAMPVMAFTYMLGGVSPARFWATLLLLAVTCVEVGMFSLVCSAYCQTTVSALVTTYLVGTVLLTCFVPCNPLVLVATMSTSDDLSRVMFLLGSAAVNVIVSGVLLAVATIFMVERAFVEPKNYLLEFFKVLDHIFWNMNEVTGGIVLFNENTTLPKDHAIAWRETSKKSLGTVRYLFRILAAIESPLALILAWISGETVYYSQSGVAANLVSVLWVLAILMISIKATSLVSSERTHQTLEVLLTIPLSGKEILLEKFQGVRRLMLVLAIPFLTVLGFEAWWERGGWTQRNFNLWVFCATSLLSIVIFMPLIAWFSMWVGLKVHSQGRAILVSLGLILTWVFLPLLFQAKSLPYASGVGLDILSPAYVVLRNEARSMNWYIAAGLCSFYGILVYGIRRLCLTRADRYLGRREAEPEPATAGEVAVSLPIAKQVVGNENA